jgi:hypothetical protein
MQNAEKDLAAGTKNFARRIIRPQVAPPKERVGQVPGRRVLPFGTSIGANHREANRGRSKAEFISKAGETADWSELLAEDGIVPRK